MKENKKISHWYYCAKIDIETVFKGKETQVQLMFDKLLSSRIDWQDISFSATKNCIVFVKHKTFLIVRPMKKN